MDISSRPKHLCHYYIKPFILKNFQIIHPVAYLYDIGIFLFAEVFLLLTAISDDVVGKKVSWAKRKSQWHYFESTETCAMYNYQFYLHQFIGCNKKTAKIHTKEVILIFRKEELHVSEEKMDNSMLDLKCKRHDIVLRQNKPTMA